MPGIVGFAGNLDPAEVAPRLDRMVDALRHHPWYITDRHAEPGAGVALGRVSLGAIDPAPQPATTEDGGLAAVLYGEILDAPAVRARLQAAGHRFQGASHAEILLHGYEQEGASFFRSHEGSFAAAIWDRRQRRLILATDRFGMRPLYYTRCVGGLAFGSELKALLTDAGVARRLDPVGVAQFFTFGHLFNQETLLDDVAVLPAAGCAVYDIEADQLVIDGYEPPLHATVDTRLTRADHLDRIDSALAAAVARSTQGDARLGVSLSGGLDARTILGLIDHERVPITSVCLGIDGSLDHRCAQQMADAVGCTHHRHVLDHAFLDQYEQHLQTMVRLTDGQYLCQCIVMPTLPLYRELGVEVLLRGHAGELMHMGKAYNYSLGPEALTLNEGAAVESWLRTHLSGFLSGPAAPGVFRAPFRNEIAGLASASLTTALAGAQGIDPPIHRIWHVFLTQRLRRETALSMAEFHSVVETRLPFLDSQLIAALFAAPPELKLDETIQAHILRKRRPEFLRIVNANTGARLDASPLGKQLAYFRLRVLSKLQIKGYEPYERLGLWLRRELKPLVSRLLLNDEALDPELFDPQGIRRVVDDHWAGRHNYTYLILALMIFAEARRQFRAPTPPRPLPVSVS
jgi:asparagine synthase (glutamine-hydrolysing)